MDDKTKNDFDAVNELAKIFWAQFNERRKYEFQVSVAIWTAMASLILIIFNQQKALKEIHCIYNYIYAFGLIVFCIHLLWINGIFKGNLHDSHKAHFFTNLMQEKSGSKFENGKKNHLIYSSLKYDNEVKALSIEKRFIQFFELFYCWTYSQICQCLITYLLFCIALFASAKLR